jgi:hypothetical protein
MWRSIIFLPKSGFLEGYPTKDFSLVIDSLSVPILSATKAHRR